MRPRSAAARRTARPGRKAGQAPERIPAPIRRAAALFLYLARPGAGFSPFPGFPRRVGKCHPSHRQKSASKPPNVWGVALSFHRTGTRPRSAALRASLVSDQLQRPPMPPSRESLQRFFVVPSPRCPPLQKGPPISPPGVCPSLPCLTDQRRPACAPDPEGRARLHACACLVICSTLRPWYSSNRTNTNILSAERARAWIKKGLRIISV